MTKIPKMDAKQLLEACLEHSIKSARENKQKMEIKTLAVSCLRVKNHDSKEKSILLLENKDKTAHYKLGD